MDEAGKREFGGANTASGSGCGFKNADGASCLGETDGSRKTVRAGADDDGVKGGEVCCTNGIVSRGAGWIANVIHAESGC